MADDLLESNIIIKTKVANPNREGFRTIHSDLDKIVERLNYMSSRPWIIKLQVDDSQLRAYGLSKKVSTGNPGSSSNPVVTTPAGTPAGGQPFVGRGYYRRTTIGTDSSSLLEKSRGVVGSKQVTESVTTNLETGQVSKLVTEELDLFEKAIKDRLKANADSLKQERKEAERIAGISNRRTDREAKEYLKGLSEEEKRKQREADRIAGINVQRSNREARKILQANSVEDLNRRFNSEVAGGGYELRPNTTKFNSRTGESAQIRTAVRTTGNPFTGYTVEIVKANEATKTMTKEVLEHSRAMKFLGDSYQNAISKVILWSAATSSVFAATLAVKAAAVEVAKLEENTVLLARVGGAFAGGSNNFKDRFEAAKKLTDQIVQLTTIYGSQASQAQEAATVFARAGRTEQETLEATRVALIASRIAELDVVDAATLLSGAMLQFNLSASQLLPTLDALNTLSNNYRVTTNDLLQAISRTGAVYAEHNGQLTELASITAVVAQATSRSGSEIGNALKTIYSNLDRVDTQSALFKTLGTLTVDYEDKTKSLGRTLFELKNSFESLASQEEKQLTLQIAGVRQRNILVTAIKQADDALIAENKLLQDTGSSSREFYESAGTLIASLERLQATLIKLANISGSALNPIIKGFVNIVDFGVRLLTLFGKLPVQIVTLVGSVYLLHRGLTLALSSLQAFASGTIAASAAQTVNTTVTTAQATSLTLLQRGYIATAAASKSFIASGGLLTAGLVLTAGVLSDLTTANASYSDTLESSNIALQQSIDRESNRRRALDNTSIAIVQLIKRYEELKAAGKNEEAAATQKRGEKIGSSVGFNLSSGNFNLESLGAQYQSQQRESIDSERKLLIRQRNQAVERIGAFKSELRAATESNKDVENPGFFGIRNDQQKTRVRQYAFGSQESRSNIIKQNRLQEAAISKKIEDTEDEIKNIAQKINDLAERKLAIDSSLEQGARARLFQIKDELKTAEILQNLSDRKAISDLNQAGAYRSLVKSYAEVSGYLQEQLPETEKIVKLYERGAITQQDAAASVENSTKLLEKQKDLLTEIYKQQQGAAQGAATNLFGSRNRLLEQVGRGSLEASRRNSGASLYTDDLAFLKLRQKQQEDRLRVARRVLRGTIGDNSAESSGQARAAQLEAQSAIVNLKSIEEEKALAIFEIEKNIAIERRKSADEAARAVGALSREDKLRLRVISQYFTNNPNKRFSLEEQLTTGEKTGRLIGQFFPGRLETLGEGTGFLSRQFQQNGFGLSSDLLKAQAEIGTLRRGRSDSDILNQTMSRLQDLERRQSAAGGVPLTNNQGFSGALGFGPGNGVNAFGAVDTRIPINLGVDTQAFQNLINSFEVLAGQVMDQKIDSFAGQVRQIVREEQALNKRVLPKTALPTN